MVILKWYTKIHLYQNILFSMLKTKIVFGTISTPLFIIIIIIIFLLNLYGLNKQ